MKIILSFLFSFAVSGKYQVEWSKMRAESWIRKRKSSIQERLQKMIKCICSGEQIRVDELEYDSSESLATRDYSMSGHSLRPGENDTKVDNSNIEEAESSLRETGYLNYEVRSKYFSSLIGLPLYVELFHVCNLTDIFWGLL